LLVPGVHASGIDEPRLVGFARDLAAQGHRVVTVELPDLKAYSITPRTTDQIEDAAKWTMSRPEYRGSDGRIGLMGISFGGGLAVAAAGRPSISQGLAFVLSLGGHGDLPRTLKYLCTGVQPDGVHRPPHDYGLAIVLLGAAQHVVPKPEVEPLRNAILSFLEASRLDMIDRTAAAKEFARAKQLEAQLREPAKTYMDYVNTRDVEKLGPVLVPYLPDLGGDPGLSPDRSTPPACPVFLLHGSDDNVVPAIESTLLASTLRGEGTSVRVLLSPPDSLDVASVRVTFLPAPVLWPLGVVLLGLSATLALMSSPPSRVLPLVDSTWNTPLFNSRIERSNVPPPRS